MAKFIVNENPEAIQADTSKTPQDSDDMGLKDDKVPISVSINNEEEREMFSRSQHQ